MNSLMKRMSVALMALFLVISLLVGVVPADTFAVSLAYNTGTRHDYNVELSDQAVDYYTGNYTWEKLSSLEGGDENCLDIYNPMFETLHDLMADTMTNSVSYSSLPDYWEYTDTAAGASGKVVAFYTDSKTSIGSINREHVWPKSHASFKEKNGGCDLHHLRPTFNNVNSSRGNLIMGNVRATGSYSTYSYNGKDVLYKTSSLCEVNDNIKGDVARILLYVWCRWEEPNLFKNTSNPVIGPSDDKNDGGKVIESLDTLLEWCEIDPVDTWEMSRNDRVQDVQGNRNVFIDYPEFAWLIFGQDVPDDYNTPSDNGGSATNPDCVHQWNDATCTEPETCSKCGKTQGAANGHGDSHGDNLCDVCGTALGCIHQWNVEFDTTKHYEKCTLCGDTKNTAVHTLVNNQCQCGYAYTPAAGNTFVKVTTAPTDWSGEYLIVYEGGSLAFDGSLTSLDVAKNTISVEINDNTIVLDEKNAGSSFIIEPKGDAYSIQSGSGYYIGSTTNTANKLNSSTNTVYLNKITLNSDGTVNIKADVGSYLRFNSGTSDMRFRYYKSGTYSAQESITLYKRAEHSHSYESAVTPPTCTKGGYTTYTCACGDSYKADETEATSHSYTSEQTKDPTCTEAGEMTYTCGNCSDTYTEEVEAKGHTKETIPAVDASCTVSGWTAGVKCSVCQEVLNAPVETGTLPHTNDKYEDNLDGTHKISCSVCGAVENANAEHIYDNDADTTCNACGAERKVEAEAELNVYLARTRLKDLLNLAFFFNMTTEEEVIEVGALVWTDKDATRVPYKAKAGNGYYSVEVDGVFAQEIDTRVYIIPYVQTVNGYAYGQEKSTSVLSCMEYMYGSKDETAATKAVIKDLLNYANAAREYFVAKGTMTAPSKAFNAVLSEADRELAWSDEYRGTVATVQETTGEFVPSHMTVVCGIQEALRLRFESKDANVSGFVYWTEEDYVATNEHTKETATGEMEFVRTETVAKGYITGIYSYEMYDNFFVRAYNAEGKLTKTFTRSVAAYLTYDLDRYTDSDKAEDQAYVELCKAMLIYGYTAKNSDAITKS